MPSVPWIPRPTSSPRPAGQLDVRPVPRPVRTNHRSAASLLPPLQPCNGLYGRPVAGDPLGGSHAPDQRTGAPVASQLVASSGRPPAVVGPGAPISLVPPGCNLRSPPTPPHLSGSPQPRTSPLACHSSPESGRPPITPARPHPPAPRCPALQQWRRTSFRACEAGNVRPHPTARGWAGNERIEARRQHNACVPNSIVPAIRP